MKYKSIYSDIIYFIRKMRFNFNGTKLFVAINSVIDKLNKILLK